MTTTPGPNPNDPTHPSPFDESGFPTRHVALFCDNDCGTETEADVIADTRAEAFAGLRDKARHEGWEITPTRDTCPDCRATVRTGNQA